MLKSARKAARSDEIISWEGGKRVGGEKGDLPERETSLGRFE